MNAVIAERGGEMGQMSFEAGPIEAIRPPHINDVDPWSDADLEGLRAVHEVLTEFGVEGDVVARLWHEHFPLEEGHALVTREDGRRQVTTPEPVDGLDPRYAAVTAVNFAGGLNEGTFELAGAEVRMYDFPVQDSTSLGGLALGERPEVTGKTGFTTEDLPMLRRVRAALQQHGMEGRISLSTDHPSKFLGDGELFVETHVGENTLIMDPLQEADIDPALASIATTFDLSVAPGDTYDDTVRAGRETCTLFKDADGHYRHYPVTINRHPDDWRAEISDGSDGRRSDIASMAGRVVCMPVQQADGSTKHEKVELFP